MTESARPADPYTRFVSRVLFPLQERAKRHSTVDVRRALETSQWWTAERIADFQLRRLRALLADADANSAVLPRDVRDERLRPFSSAIDCGSAAPAVPHQGGHTSADGRPQVAPGRAAAALAIPADRVASPSCSTSMPSVSATTSPPSGARPAGAASISVIREVVVWGSPIELGAQDRMRQVRDRMLRTTLLPAFEMSRGEARWLPGVEFAPCVRACCLAIRRRWRTSRGMRRRDRWPSTTSASRSPS